ncbi:hypothetical protein Tco_1328669 [Tanacetum coccineum]
MVPLSYPTRRPTHPTLQPTHYDYGQAESFLRNSVRRIWTTELTTEDVTKQQVRLKLEAILLKRHKDGDVSVVDVIRDKGKGGTGMMNLNEIRR